MRITTKAALAAMLMFGIIVWSAHTASAQVNVDLSGDRYKGYPSSLVPRFKSAPTAAEIAKCAASKPYEPADTHLYKYVTRVKVATVRVQETDECTGMRTAAGDALVKRLKGTKVAIDELGRDLFDFGSPGGAICGNPRLFSIPVNVPPAPPQVAAAPPPPPPAAALAPPVIMPPPPIVRPAPVPVPAATEVRAASKPRLNVTVGVDYTAGHVQSEYLEAIPNAGDVPQRHNFSALVPTIKVNQYGSGLYGSFASHVLQRTSNKEYQAIDGWNTKRRDSDDSVDKNTKFKVGYGRSIGEYFTVAGFMGWQRFCVCDKYFAQFTDTVTERNYRGMILGGELSGATDSLDHQIRVNLGVEFGPSLKRTQWTQQVYQGKPFDRANNPEADGHSLGFNVGVDVQVHKAIHANLGFDYLGLKSTRTNTYVADERVSVSGFKVGVSYQLTK